MGASILDAPDGRGTYEVTDAIFLKENGIVLAVSLCRWPRALVQGGGGHDLLDGDEQAL